MDDTLTHLGVGGILALLIIREVLNFLKTRNGNGTGKKTTSCGAPSQECKTFFAEMSQMHNVRDDDNVPKWYVPGALKDLAQANHDTNILMVQTLSDIKDILKENQGLLREKVTNG